MIRRSLAPIALLAFYGVLIFFANHRHLWHDELYTFYIASAPSLSDLRQNLLLDLNPPLLYLLSRVTMSIFGNTAFAVRLPSIVAFFAGSLCLYTLVRRRFQSSAYGALAVIVFWATPAFYFATEARPYGLILGFFALAMFAWYRRSPWSTLLLAFSISGMMLSHFFAIFFLTPFLAAETVRWFRTRQIDWPVLAALLIPCLLPFTLLKVHAPEAFPAAFQAGFRKMASYYYWALYEEIWVLSLGIIAVRIVRCKPQKLKCSFSEISFIAALVALPFVVNAVLMLLHGAFFTRYAAPALYAIALIYTVLVARYTGTNRFAALAICAVLAIYVLHHETKPLPHRPDFSQIHPDLPLVTASGLTFLEMDHEEPPATVNRLYYLTDRDLALTYAHATLFEGLPIIKQRLPIRAHIEPFKSFIRTHPKFLVLGTPNYPEDWLLRYLKTTSANLQLLGTFPSEYKDTQLFLVELPPAP